MSVEGVEGAMQRRPLTPPEGPLRRPPRGRASLPPGKKLPGQANPDGVDRTAPVTERLSHVGASLPRFGVATTRVTEGF